MAYLPSFEYDIFISYAHVDNLVPRGGGRGWVDRFQEELELELSRRLGRVGAAKIWWDNSLDGSQETVRSEEHTSELQSLTNLVCRLLLAKKQMKRAHEPSDWTA